MERRDITRRAELVYRIVAEIVQKSAVEVTTNRLSQTLSVPIAAAERILQRLVSGGILLEVRRGVWADRNR